MAKFIFKRKKLIQNIKKLNKSFEDEETDFNIFYSVKTNFSPPVLKTIDEFCNFEIVSAYEWDKVKKYQPQALVLNGPTKSKQLIEEIIDSGVKKLYLNLDNDTDLDILSKLNENYFKNIELGLRVYLNKFNVWNRFGFDIDSEKTEKIIKKLQNKIKGFHFHFSTNNFSLNNYSQILEKIEKIIKKYNLNITYLDIGGGLPGASEILKQKQTYQDLPNLIKMFVKKSNSKIRIISEVGRNLVQDVFKLETEIVSLKETGLDSMDIVIDVNIMHFPCFWEKKYSLDFKPKSNKKEIKTINIFGNSCMQVDKIAENEIVTFKPQVGDKIILNNVGAYSLSQATNFISKIPSVVER